MLWMNLQSYLKDGEIQILEDGIIDEKK